jgi:hypothetical protein
MIPRQKAEWIIYALIIALSVIALTLAFFSSSFAFDNRVVYQGF